LEAGILDRTIEGAQTRVEGYNFDIRKHTVEFDDVMNKQRQIIYADRREILDGEGYARAGPQADRRGDCGPRRYEYLPDERSLKPGILTNCCASTARSTRVLPPRSVRQPLRQGRDEIESWLVDQIEHAYEEREKVISPEKMRFCRATHDARCDRPPVDRLPHRDGRVAPVIMLQAFAQRDPLVEFKRQSFQMFDQLKDNIARDVVYNVIIPPRLPVRGLPAPDRGRAAAPVWLRPRSPAAAARLPRSRVKPASARPSRSRGATIAAPAEAARSTSTATSTTLTKSCICCREMRHLSRWRWLPVLPVMSRKRRRAENRRATAADRRRRAAGRLQPPRGAKSARPGCRKGLSGFSTKPKTRTTPFLFM
jgi:hypothetical protein